MDYAQKGSLRGNPLRRRFLRIGQPHTIKCERNMELMHKICTETGLPIEPQDSRTALLNNIFGIEVDSDAPIPIFLLVSAYTALYEMES